MARLARIATYPIKSLDPHERRRVEIVENGGLAGDREFAMVGPDGNYVNGKRTAAVHRLRATYADDLSWVELRVGGDGSGGAKGKDKGKGSGELKGDGPGKAGVDGGSPTGADGDCFPLRAAGDGGGGGNGDGDHDRLTAFLSDYFGIPVTLRRDRAGGMPDDTDDSGPTVISTATIREVASWFDGVDPDGVRHRLRASLEVDGVEPFWEDRLYAADPDDPVRFRIGEAELLGTGPCRRCVVPSRDPWTGETTEGFRERFVEKRRETLPDWAPRERFEGFFKLMVNTRVPEREWEKEVTVGDEVAILDGDGA